MIYETKTRWLTINKNKKVRLSKLEHKLLIALSDENANSYETISKYMYGYYEECCKFSIRKIKLTIERKGVKIKSIYGVGYALESKILFK